MSPRRQPPTSRRARLIREAQAALFPTLSASYTATRSYGGAGDGSATSATTVTGRRDHVDLRSRRFRLVGSRCLGQGAAADREQCFRGAGQRRRSRQCQALPPRRSSPPPISICARPMLCRRSCCVRFRNTRRHWRSFVISSRPAIPFRRPTWRRPRARSSARNRWPSMSACNAPSLSTPSRCLIGRPPAELTIARRPLSGAIPKLPVSVPFGIARAAARHRRRGTNDAGAKRAHRRRRWLHISPTSASLRSCSGAAAGLFPSMQRMRYGRWARLATQILFDGGLRGAQVDAARAVYWQSVATYRQTVLSAFQGVEDELAAIRVLTQQLGRATEGCQLSAGGRSDLSESVSRLARLRSRPWSPRRYSCSAYEQSELTIRQNLFLASVALIQDLGGGWDVNLLPTKKELESDFSLLPQLPPDRAGLRLESPETSASR